MDIILHWETSKLNFVNQEVGKSSKHRMGTKPSTLRLTTTISVNRDRLDLKFKKMLSNALYKVAPALHRDMRVNIFIDRLYILSSRDLIKLSNDITNILIKTNYMKVNTLDKIISYQKVGAI